MYITISTSIPLDTPLPPFFSICFLLLKYADVCAIFRWFVPMSLRPRRVRVGTASLDQMQAAAAAVTAETTKVAKGLSAAEHAEVYSTAQALPGGVQESDGGVDGGDSGGGSGGGKDVNADGNGDQESDKQARFEQWKDMSALLSKTLLMLFDRASSALGSSEEEKK